MGSNRLSLGDLKRGRRYRVGLNRDRREFVFDRAGFDALGRDSKATVLSTRESGAMLFAATVRLENGRQVTFEGKGSSKYFAVRDGGWLTEIEAYVRA